MEPLANEKDQAQILEPELKDQEENKLEEKDESPIIKKKTKKAAPLVFNCYKADANYAIVKKMIDSNPGWTESLNKEKCDLRYLWPPTHATDAEAIDILKNQTGCLINRYPYINHICNKDYF